VAIKDHRNTDKYLIRTGVASVRCLASRQADLKEAMDASVRNITDILKRVEGGPHMVITLDLNITVIDERV
jgi:hypothetical protein